MKIFRTLILVSILFITLPFATGMGDDFSIIRQRIIDPLKTSGNINSVKSYIENQNEDGSWNDVDYEDTNTGNWATMKHISRIQLLAKPFRTEGSELFGDESCKNAISKALDYWYEKDFINNNWWWNEIGVPGSLANTLLLFDSELTDDQRNSGIEILKRAKISMTGANLVDVAVITVKRGLLENDGETVRTAINRIADEIIITTSEGVQPDFSFHQHGPLLYNHGYGEVFSRQCGMIATLVTGTQFAFPQEKIDILSDLILEGTRWMVRKATRDYGATGRGLVRAAGANGSAYYLKSIIESMLLLPTGRETEFIALKEQVEGLRDTSVIGNRHFWRGEIMTHHRDNYYMSARMYSKRNYNTDGAHNGEGLLNHYLGDGCTYIMQSGMEYHNIFPVWDWQKIPGTTVELTPSHPAKINIMGSTSFAGGVSDGTYGVASFDFKRDRLTAKKSWFFFDDEIVCLGSGISSVSDYPVVTTLNQCFLNGTVTVSSSGSNNTANRGDHTLDNTTWIHHDNVAYLFMEPVTARMSNQPESGSWQRITAQGSDATIEHDVFTLWLEHGASADNAAYAYTVMPGMSLAQTEAYADNPQVSVIENSTARQMVVHKTLGISGIVFHEAGEVELSDGVHVSVDTPCIALVTKLLKGYDISIADPECTQKTVTVTLEATTGNSHNITFELDGGLFAGKTLTKRILFTAEGIGVNDVSPVPFELHQNTPNPFNPSTTIRFTLAAPSPVELTVFDIAGRKVATLIDNKPFAAGEHETVFNGAGLASGVYVYRCHAGDVARCGRMTLMK